MLSVLLRRKADASVAAVDVVVGGGALMAGVGDCTPVVGLAVFPLLTFTATTGVVGEGADNFSNPLAIKSKNRVLDVKFRRRRWSVPIKGLVRRGIHEHFTKDIVVHNLDM
jgi:hypothetical protein